MAFFACGTRDKLNARPVGATRHLVVASGSLFGTGLIFSRCKALLVLMGLGCRSFWRWIFWKCLKIYFNFSSCTRRYGRHFRNVPKCRLRLMLGRRDSASAWSAAAPRCVASLLACCAGKRFAFPQLRTLAGSNSSACPQESALGRYGLRALSFNGWDGGIRTPNSRHQKPEFYR